MKSPRSSPNLIKFLKRFIWSQTIEDYSRDQKDANQRSIEDYSSSTLYMRLGITLLFWANGGAAIAMVSFLTSIITSENKNIDISSSDLVSNFASASFFFFIGVVCTIISLSLFSYYKKIWGHFWELVAQESQEKEIKNRYQDITNKQIFIVKAIVSERTAYFFLFCGIMSLIPGAYFAVNGFFVH